MNADLNVFKTRCETGVSGVVSVRAHKKHDDGRPSDSFTWAATKRASHDALTLAMLNSRNRHS